MNGRDEAHLAEPLLRLAREFGSVAETFRAVQLHGRAADFEARKFVIETLAANAEVMSHIAACNPRRKVHVVSQANR